MKKNGFVLLQTFDSLDIDYIAGFGRHYFINIQCKNQPNHKCVCTFRLIIYER